MTSSTTDTTGQVLSGGRWMTYNPLTATYDTRDGTQVAAELVETVQCFADVLYISRIRSDQRAGPRPAAAKAVGHVQPAIDCEQESHEKNEP